MEVLENDFELKVDMEVSIITKYRNTCNRLVKIPTS